MQQTSPRYYVRVGQDVRGPVDEATVASWIAQGMRRAEVCPEGAAAFVPLEQTPLARYLSTKSKAGSRLGGGAATAVALGLLLLIRACNRQTDQKIAQIKASLPAVGSQGELRAEEPLRLCPPPQIGWAWPCDHKDEKVIAPGSRVQIMKTETSAAKGMCRYWVQGGPDDRFVGDGLCAWFHGP
jgi:hypothetical protein